VVLGLAACTWACWPSGKPPVVMDENQANGSVIVRPGEVAVFSAPLLSYTNLVVTLLSARLIPVPGFPTPRLAHLAMLGSSDNGYPAGTSGWPPRRHFTLNSSVRISLRPFHGDRVDTAIPKKGAGLPPTVLYGVVGERPHTVYATAGLELTYRYGGSDYTIPVYQGGAACLIKDLVPANIDKADYNFCENGVNRAFDATYNMT
jgi:hypothetical protein